MKWFVINLMILLRVYRTDGFVISNNGGFVMLRNHSHYDAVVIAVFAYASDARRALNLLREHQFSNDEVTAAFREPAATPASSAGGRWFGQLRQLYQGEGRSEPAAGSGPPEFEAKLSQLDLSEQDAAALDRELGRGGAIVTVRAGARNQEAQALLEQRGARILRGRDSEPATAAPAVAAPAAPEPTVTSTPFTAPRPADPGHIQLFGEVLRVHKEKVSSGDVQVRKEAVTQMETVQVPVTREHLVVEHTDGSGRTDPKESIRVPLSEERVHIDKDTVLREEYKVGKREVTQQQSVSDKVRRERLLIDDAQSHADES
jgi:uncharacterized protein (TIGR02271 family)